ncbi:MAG: DEAD/DEAH box helicase family protein [Megamonas funiformis]|uniref:DEAD/DEAH box helicase n=1 Tax=Megamonas funiformis TaxID=437897 RepID=UPI002A7EE4D4|nr:DEAD/DEAH box helicase [Megamonas funiformis]MDY3874309.1 DEAD/DEAH box helicase family protein [Megamonas funiformis]
MNINKMPTKPQLNPSTNLDIEYIFNDTCNFVSDLIGDDWLYKWIPNTPIFISAQTGKGKNYFIQNVMVPKILEYNRRHRPINNILILSNRIALNQQNKLKLAQIIDKYSINSISYVNKLNELTINQINEFYDFGAVKISSYHQLLKNNLLNEDYSFVIIDECHFFIQDSVFNADTTNILKNIISKQKNSIHVYMSATLDEIFPIILPMYIKKKITSFPYDISTSIASNETLYLLNSTFRKALPFYYKINYKNIEFKYTDEYTDTAYFYDEMGRRIVPYYHPYAVIYDIEPNYDYIKTHVLSHNKDSLIEKISSNHNKDSKWLIFVKSKRDGEYLQEKLSQKNISVEFISSESKNSTNTAYQQIIKECKFDTDVLISTAVIDNGVNLFDINIKNIVISIFDYTSFIQMLGRIRPLNNQKINLYLLDFTIYKLKEEFTRNLYNIYDCLIFNTLSDTEQLDFYKNKIQQGQNNFSFDTVKKRPYYSTLSLYKFLNNVYFYIHFFKDITITNNLNDSKKNQLYNAINYLSDIKYDDNIGPNIINKIIKLLKNDIFPEKPIGLNIFTETIDSDYLRRLINYTFDLYTQNQISFRQYVYLKRIQYFFSEIIHLNDYLKSKSFSPEYTKPVHFNEEKSFLIQKIEKYVKLFNHNDLSFDYKDIPYSPIIYQQLLWLEKFELDSIESSDNPSLTKEKLIEELNQFAVSKQEYSEAQTNNADRNDLLLNKGFPSNDKDNEPIYQKIQELITNIKGKGDFKTTKKINDFFSEQHIPFEIISTQTTTNKKTYWLILKL